MHKNRLRAYAVLSLSLVAGAFSLAGAACGGSSSGGTTEPGCFDYSSFDDTTPEVDFKKDVLPILRTSCGLSSSCHSEETPPVPAQHYLGSPLSQGDLTDAQIQEIFAQSVSKDSVDEPGMNVITPGDPEHSFLLYKVDGDPAKPGLTCSTLKCAANNSCGTSMPQGGPALDDASKKTLRLWIAQGAKN